MKFAHLGLALICSLLLSGCLPAAPKGEAEVVYDVANQCFGIYVLGSDEGAPFRKLSPNAAGDGYLLVLDEEAEGSSFYLKASGLGTYLFFDEAASYLVSDGSALGRVPQLLSDIKLVDDSFESDAEWALEGADSTRRLALRHVKSGRYLTEAGVLGEESDAVDVELFESEECMDFPEASLDAWGEPRRAGFEDGSLFGVVDAHSHILSNFGFGGGGLFHGAPFHPLGIEHALADCEQFHGVDGRQDLFGFGFDNRDADAATLLGALVAGQTPVANHATAGWPEFTDWPNAPGSSTHQVQYYKWLQRAYLGGLRLVVQHATTNQIICDQIAGAGIQPVRYSCNDMVGVDRILDEIYEMQDYIDAQEGGPGEGWFRIVRSAEEAREVIGDGQMAVILGIETSNLFDCFLTPPAGFAACTPETVLAKLDEYYDRGVRVLFPVHKYDNAFSAGDGSKQIIEIGNFIQTGHFSNFTTDCDPSIPTTFDKGPASFPGLIQTREDYFAPAPNDLSGFAMNPIGTLLPFFGLVLQPPGTVEVCQKAGLTPLGEFLITEMMHRGMILELDHLPRRSYKRAFEMLTTYDYPAVGTHGLDNSGAIYQLGGLSTTGFGRCQSATASATMDDGFQAKIQLIEDNGGFPAEGFGFDLNGFAGAPGPRFGPNSGCSSPQTNPITYPFSSYGGNVTFEAPQVGNRSIDFNTEGLAHIGLLPELIEDVRRDGVSDAELEPLFKSAEAYIRVWEKSERRGLELSGVLQPN